MPTRARIHLGGALAAILVLPFCAAGTSWAQTQSSVDNEQVQLGDVLSNQTLNVEDSSAGVSGSASTVGNIVAATGQNAPIDVRSDQEAGGHVEAAVNGVVTGDSGPYFSTTVNSIGNSATAGTSNGATTGSSLQAIDQGAVIAGDAASQTGGTAGAASVDSSAVGNTTGWEQIGGSVQSWTGQTNQGLVSASNTGGFATVTGNTGLSATAVGNNVTGDITNATTDIGVGQDMSGQATNATVDVSIARGADIQGMTSGVGNNVDVQATGAQAGMNVTQTNNAPVSAYTNLDAATWTGDATATAYGVGNSVLLANNGPQGTLWSQQTSAGDVNATASFTGGAGGAVAVATTAVGNEVSGFVCASCGGALSATNHQSATGGVHATSAVSITGKATQISGSASAIGNSATYQVTSGD